MMARDRARLEKAQMSLHHAGAPPAELMSLAAPTGERKTPARTGELKAPVSMLSYIEAKASKASKAPAKAAAAAVVLVDSDDDGEELGPVGGAARSLSGAFARVRM